MKKSLIPILMTLLFSCSAILGLKEPRILSESEFTKKCQEFNVDTLRQTKLSGDAIEKLKIMSYKPNWEVGFKPLQVRMYNKNGNLISQYSTCEGSLKRTEIFTQFPPKNYYKLDSSFTILDEFDLHSEKLTVNYMKNDLTIFIWWGSWLGKPMKNLINSTKKYVQANSDKKIEIFYVNVLDK